MSKINEYFSTTKLSELKTTVQQEIPEYIQGGGWEANRPRERAAFYVRQARQQLEVYDAREKLAELARMIEGIKEIEGKVEEIQNFVEANDLDSMVDFSSWDDPMEALPKILRADLEGDALQWMHSDHSC